MSSESVCQVARSWVDVGSFHTRLFGVVSVREFLDTRWYVKMEGWCCSNVVNVRSGGSHFESRTGHRLS
jgi:hypothetical protein